MKVIQLTGGQVAIVDDEYFERLAQWRWRLSPDGYAIRTGSTDSNGKRKTVSMHREVFGPDCSGKECDHKNGNKLDNRRENLRSATRAQNQQNRSIRPGNKVGLKGVCYRKKEAKFCAAITANGVRKCLGSFSNAADAHRAYCEAAARLHGEFARFN